MALSARNRLDGTVQSIETDSIMAEVTVETTGGQTVTAVITTSSVERLGIAEGDEVNAVIKAAAVMVETE